jgi:hypothetical protein
MYEKYHSLIKMVVGKMRDPGQRRQVEWGCGINRDLTPYRLHRGRRFTIVVKEPACSLGSIHTHPTGYEFPSPPSLDDLAAHCYGFLESGHSEYVSIAAAPDPRYGNIIVWVLSGAPCTNYVDIILDRYAGLPGQAMSCSILSLRYLHYMMGIKKACDDLGITLEEFHVEE